MTAVVVDCPRCGRASSCVYRCEHCGRDLANITPGGA